MLLATLSLNPDDDPSPIPLSLSRFVTLGMKKASEERRRQ